jgi:hypothetical protein
MDGSLFNPIVAEDKLHPSFVKLRDVADHPGRAMLEEIFAEYDDIDGNFLEQFQTTGFDARLFELYLFALFSRHQYALDRRYPHPDFIIERIGVRVAIEATTVNPPTSGPLQSYGKRIEDLSFKERLEYEQHELAIRFGSPLFSKLQKRYWELEHCSDLPLVLFVQAFHDKDALAFSDNALTRYLYGLDQTTGEWRSDGSLEVFTAELDAHHTEGKSIPSNFFRLPGAEHISAVVFTNSGTLTKFDRLGIHHGYGAENYLVQRFGTALNPHPDAMDPTMFLYDVGQPPFVETWLQGLVVNHNPNATIPLPDDFFGTVVNVHLEEGRLVHVVQDWHPISSKTIVINAAELKSKLPKQLVTRTILAVEAVPRQRFGELVGFSYESNPVFEEHGWFSDISESFVGVVLHDISDDDWGWVILARDPHFCFRAIEAESSEPYRRAACQAMQQRMMELLMEPKRIFVQD